MNKITSNYNKQEIQILEEESQKFGMSLEVFQKYHTLLSLRQNNTIPISTLENSMLNKLSTMKNGDVFIVSTLIPDEWVFLNKNEKHCLAMYLYDLVKSNPHKYRINRTVNENINQYIVL